MVETLSYVSSQLMSFAIEGISWLSGNAALRKQTRAVRVADRHYRNALALQRQGRPEEAFTQAKTAYAALGGTDRSVTFLLIGAPIVMLLDELAGEIQPPRQARAELVETLEVLREVQADPKRKSRQLFQIVNWLEHRVYGDTDLEHE